MNPSQPSDDLKRLFQEHFDKPVEQTIGDVRALNEGLAEENVACHREIAALEARLAVTVGALEHIADFGCEYPAVSGPCSYPSGCRTCTARAALAPTGAPSAKEPAKCPTCGGTGMVDAGIAADWKTPMRKPCLDCTPTQEPKT